MAEHTHPTLNGKELTHDHVDSWVHDLMWPSIEGTQCPMTSSITGAPCQLEDGHPMYSPTRFHKFPPPQEATDV